MAEMVYRVSREHAAQVLGISTRTIDRYVKSGKLSYKKIANKVLLNQGEVDDLQQEFQMLHQQMPATEIVSQPSVRSQVPQGQMMSYDMTSIDKKIDRFFEVFDEKERLIEDKNKVIFMLQQRIGELETKIQNMIALPDYSQEKQEYMLEKEKLENRIVQIQASLRNEKLKNIIYIGLDLRLCRFDYVYESLESVK